MESEHLFCLRNDHSQNSTALIPQVPSWPPRWHNYRENSANIDLIIWTGKWAALPSAYDQTAHQE
jgi:hypothetical protein